MTEGHILAAREGGAYVLRLTGDVRLTMCASLEDYVEAMLNDPEFVSVWVDLCEAEGIDSTTLGQLAKLGISVKQRFGFRPAIYSSDPGINRLLDSMGIGDLFEMHEEKCSQGRGSCDIPMVPGTEDKVREQVLDAHRVLMGINEENRRRFSELVSTLERG